MDRRVQDGVLDGDLAAVETALMALPTINRSTALSGEGNGGEGIGESVVMAEPYE
ncbi:hypothetical protein ACH4WW_30890 [Streptomyces halstedii]|uniref:hypothetical protein n=1 Tax=Streptomyces halstedii TaxID=1944 RepID=UPI0037A94FB8